MAARFQVVVEGNWGKLLTILEFDKEADERMAEARRRRRGRQEEEGTERKREVVFDLVAKSLVGRAASRITFHGVASIASPEVREALRSKFPARERPTKGQEVDNLGGFREALVGLELASAPGVGGMRPEFLVTLGKVMGEKDMGMLEEHSMSFLNGAYPAWFYKAEGAINTFPS